MFRKNGSSRLKQPKYKENIQDRSVMSSEVSIEKRADQMYVPYLAKKDEPKVKDREETLIRPRFWVSCKELIDMPGVSDKLTFPFAIKPIQPVVLRIQLVVFLKTLTKLC